jgi:hypothetical protein
VDGILSTFPPGQLQVTRHFILLYAMMDENPTFGADSSVSDVDAIAAQEAIEDQRARTEQETSGGALSVCL